MTSMVTTKHRLGIIVAVMVAGALAGCASGQSQTAAAPPPAPAPPSAEPAPQPAAQPAAPVQQRVSHHGSIESVQTALNANGAKVTVDGRMGPKTAAALRAFQHQHNLKVTGRPDRVTLQALGVQR
jgi:peptidoglycan hydrolase-like protein with peptidoglycan-binding domain